MSGVPKIRSQPYFMITMGYYCRNFPTFSYAKWMQERENTVRNEKIS
jgi:hypothetical protein